MKQMQSHPIDVVAIGASAGGVEALSELLRHLPAKLPAAVIVVLHRPVVGESRLPHILARVGHMPVTVARQNQKIHAGMCYVGTPSQHLTVGPGLVMKLVHDGFYRGHNIDLLFTSLARNAGPRTVGVILSGLMKDGVQGLAALKEAGGKALVQSPAEAAYEEMPRSAIAFDGPLDRVAPVQELAREIHRLVTGTDHANGHEFSAPSLPNSHR